MPPESSSGPEPAVAPHRSPLAPAGGAGALAVAPGPGPEDGLYRPLVERAGDLVYCTDREGYLTFANAATERVTGYAPGELLGRHLGELVRPDYRESACWLYAGQVERALPATYLELPCLTRGGEEVWLGQSVRLLWEDGEVAGLRAVARDIGEQREMEEELRQSEARFRAVFDSAAFGMVLMDLDGRLLDVNQAVERKFERPAERMRGTLLDDLTHPADRERTAELRGQLLRGEQRHYVTEQRIQHRGGGYLWVRLGVSVVRGAAGEPLYLVGVGLDISAHREGEERFRTVVESLGEGLLITDLDDVVLYANSRVAELTGYGPAELVGRRAHELLVPEEGWAGFQREMSKRPQGISSSYHLEHRRKDGTRCWIKVSGVPYRDAGGEIVGTLGLLEDVTERRARDEAVRRQALLFDAVSDGVMITDATGRITDWSTGAERIFGWSREEAVGETPALLHPPEEAASIIPRILAGVEAEGRWTGEVPSRRKDGSLALCEVTVLPLRDDDGRLIATIGINRDVTERRRMEEQLRHDALHDALTGLPNRLLFMERLEHASQRARRREGFLFAVLFLDLDRFKVINDSLGHHVGDELLVVIARRLQACLRTEDTVARLGGDEFAILLEDIQDVRDATRIADRILAELAAPVDLGGFDVFTGGSIGIALSSTAGGRPEHLVRNADMAMYRAKASGPARFEVFDRAMHAAALLRLQLETDLRRAVERQELSLHYQPIVALRSGGKVWGVEALLRWEHPERGILLPEDFVAVAEETGMILPIGRWVLREACRQLREWQGRLPGLGALGVAVNLSAKQFAQPDLVEEIGRVLEETGVEGERLRLEITESAIMEHPDATAALLVRLKALGVQISLDDFGTGYSSLSYLHRFPLDALKVDRSFVGSMHDGGRSAALVRTILAMARSLPVSVVAEGIETAEQLAMLRRMRCAYGQGYLFSLPLPPREVEPLLGSSLLPARA